MEKILKMGLRTGEFLLSEGNGGISREAITVSAGTALSSGQVLGFNPTTKEYQPYNPAASDGSQIAAAVLYPTLPESEEPRRAAAIVRLAEVIEARMVGLDAAAEADLQLRQIIVRR